MASNASILGSRFRCESHLYSNADLTHISKALNAGLHFDYKILKNENYPSLNINASLIKQNMLLRIKKADHRSQRDPHSEYRFQVK